jgi:hypothetical protein
MTKEKRAPALLVTGLLTAVFLLGVLATQAQAALRHLDGTVLSKNAGNRTLRIRTESGNRIRIMVNANTRFVETRQGGGGGGGGSADDGPNHG